MQVFDASSMIFAWDNYPISQFPGLWEWMAERIAEKSLVMPVAAFEETEQKVPECAGWVNSSNIELLAVNNEIVQAAQRIKRLVGIVDDNYHPKGVDENDLFIIATAKVCGGELVSDEGRQAATPEESRKRRIPSVCAMREVGVPCINFIEFFKRSDKIFR